MTDPFHMLILIEELGREFVVWDQDSRIEFKRAVRVPVHADLAIATDEIERIRTETEAGPTNPVFVVPIVDDNGEVIARVTKTLYVRRKRRRGTDTAD